jgi:hypothetical protein
MIPRVFLGFYTSFKLDNKQMQCRSINNMKLKKALLKTLTLLRKCLIKFLENSLKHILGDETMLKVKGRQGLLQNQAKTWALPHKTPPN